jgi:hypothetical protein
MLLDYFKLNTGNYKDLKSLQKLLDMIIQEMQYPFAQKIKEKVLKF